MICRKSRDQGAAAAEWEQLVRQHGSMVFRTAWRILGNAADAEDVTQDVFLEAHRLRARKPVANWGGLLRRLSTCRAIDRLRERKSVLALGPSAKSVSHGDPAEMAIERELAERLRVAVAQLPRREAEVFCMRFLEEMSYDEIAAALAIAPGAVGVALHKARAKLEALLGEEVTKTEGR